MPADVLETHRIDVRGDKNDEFINNLYQLDVGNYTLINVIWIPNIRCYLVDCSDADAIYLKLKYA